MISCNLVGGLGNYMFQVAAAYSLSIDNNDSCVFNNENIATVHKHFNTYLPNIFRYLIISNENFSSVYSEPYFHYKKIPYKNNLKLNGYFQSEKYFKHNREHILNLFSIDDVSKNYIDNKYSDILKHNTCSVHVRRGDYLRYPEHHPICSLEYYNNSINQLPKDTKFLFFSDDVVWCENTFKGENFIFVNGNEDYIDMWLMSLCKNNIIANSSFSWWGAWLNKNKNKTVIAPKEWFGTRLNHITKDVYCDDWIIL